MEKNNGMMKKLKTSNGGLIVGIVILVMGVCGLIYGFMDVNNQEAKPFTEVNGENVYAKVDVDVMTDYFATEEVNGVTHLYYLVSDKNDKYYIICLDGDNREKLNEVYDYSYNDDENAKNPEDVTITGMSKLLPSNAHKLLSEFLSQDSEEPFTVAEMKDLVGMYYLDTYETPAGDMVVTYFVAGLFGFIGLVCLIVWLLNKNRTKKNLEKYRDVLEKMAEDYDNGKVIDSEMGKLFLGNDYIVSYQGSVKVIPNKDIVWVYPFEYRQRGVVTSKSIYLITDNGKTNVVANVSWVKKNKVPFEELYQSILTKLPDALHGYTKENITLAKERYKK